MHDTTFFLMFGRQPRLPVDIILGIPHVGRTADTEEFTQNTRDNLQIAFHFARQNLTERANKQAEENSKLKSYPMFKRIKRPWTGGSTCVQTLPGFGWAHPKTGITMARTVCRLLTFFTIVVESTTHERHPTGVSPPRPYKALPSTGDTTRTSI